MSIYPEIINLIHFMEGHFGSLGKPLLFKAFQRSGITPKILSEGSLSETLKLTLIQHLMDDCFKESSVQSDTKLRMVEAKLQGVLNVKRSHLWDLKNSQNE